MQTKCGKCKQLKGRDDRIKTKQFVSLFAFVLKVCVKAEIPEKNVVTFEI
jgi:hypothetical protein